MGLPERVRVKLLSEVAEYVSATRVVQRDFPIAELLEAVVSVGGKNAERVGQILGAGSMVVGDYRYRWEPLRAASAEIEPLLTRFPDPQPDRPFDAARCVYAILHAGVETIRLPREEAARRRFLKKASFWDTLMNVAAARTPRYHTYSYRDRADVYVFEPTAEEERRLRDAAPLLPVQRTEERIRALPLEKITLLVNR